MCCSDLRNVLSSEAVGDAVAEAQEQIGYRVEGKRPPLQARSRYRVTAVST